MYRDELETLIEADRSHSFAAAFVRNLRYSAVTSINVWECQTVKNRLNYNTAWLPSPRHAPGAHRARRRNALALQQQRTGAGATTGRRFRSKAHDVITSFIQGVVEVNCGYWDHWAALHMQ